MKDNIEFDVFILCENFSEILFVVSVSYFKK